MIKFDEIWILSTLISILLMPFILLFCCKKRQEQGNQKAGLPAIKSKRCNKAPGLLNDDPDLKSEDKILQAEKGGQTTDNLIISNKRTGNNNRASREPTVTKDQCDTDLRSFLSDKNQKQQQQNQDENKTTQKQLSLAPTQDLDEQQAKEKAAAAGGKKGGKKGAAIGGGNDKPTLECTQNDSKIRTVQETQNDNDTVEGAAKAEETKETTTKKPSGPEGDGKSTMLGKSVMVGQPGMAGKSVMVGKSAAVPTNPSQQPKPMQGGMTPTSTIKPPASSIQPKSAAVPGMPVPAEGVPQSKYMAA